MKNYSIVVFLEDEPLEEVRELQKKVFELTGSRECLDAWKPHFTVGDGISVTDEELNEVEEILRNFTSTQSLFKVSLAGFGGLTDRKGGVGEKTTPYVLWIDAVMNETLEAFVEKIRKLITSKYQLWYEMPRPYTPHVTIAFRDLSKEGYEKGKMYLQELDFEKTVITSHIALVEKLSNTDKEYKRFYFRD